MTRAYKFLGRGAVGTFTGFAWPADGAWVIVDGPLDPCRNGLHVCRPRELAHWLHEELWELEIGGTELEGVDCLVVSRARLLRRIAGWDAAGAERFASACIAHAEAAVGEPLAAAREALGGGYPAIAAHQAAVAVAVAHGSGPDAEQAYATERGWQSAWIERELL